MCQQCNSLKAQATKIKAARKTAGIRVKHQRRPMPGDFVTPMSVPLALDFSYVDFLKQHLSDRVFIQVAKDMAVLSHCVSRQVGCVIVRNGRILSTGINGTTMGDVNCDTLFPAENFDPVAHRAWADDNEIHAEMNAINFAAKEGIELDGSTLYCSLQPCKECSKNLPAVGIKRIVFDTFYDRVDNFAEQVEYLKRKGVIIEKLLSEDELDERIKAQQIF